jgi:metallo-beta-lactamase class B
LLVAISALFALYPPALMGAYALLQQDNHPRAPVQIARGVYYVGASDAASYVIDTGDGLILLDAGYPSTAGQVLANIGALGFEPSDVRIILNTHAHFDHAGGLADVKAAARGAALYSSPLDAELLRRGGRGDFYLRDFFRYPPVEVDHELRDGEEVRLGNATLTAHFTPGHTRGCTSWAFPVTMHDGRTAQALVLCSFSTLSYDLTGEGEAYPNIAADYLASYDALARLPCDVFLGAHGRWFDLERKRARVAAGEADAFFDPEGCRTYIADNRRAFEAELARQRGGD